MSRTIRWGIIGCGVVTEVKSGPAYQQTDGFELAAVMRRNQHLAEDYAKRHNVEKFYSCADELINDPAIDAVYIATPPDSHKLYALRVAAAGKICCIEKPLAPTYQDCQEIVAAFEKAKLALFVSYYRRSLPRFNKIKSLLDSGEIGCVRHINWYLNKPANEVDLSQQYNWRTDKKIAVGGYFDDLASHGLDLFSYLLGEYETVKGVGINQQRLYSSYDSVSACWVHKSGITGAGSWNFGGFARQDRVTIYGSEGDISFSVFDEHPISVSSATQQKEFFIENPKNIQLHHVNNIKEQLVSGAVHPSNGRTATHTSWVMEQILANGS
ncbi:Gfo/Idh/MocA family protein [Psychrobium sp. 1_MG-2023]|uniref:Gfo/Idh/MocA family protein n=1 Tax=Psychrobium sp. 1_MG-2023 TaxID=3062624 RepID=UPI000C328C1D|nr:Gfo/Idh/MocA family oxidoreductase [Psychrobium sp. 1_MG-2023]MDP2560012.1 Gfo/Idh/MocA family oxidoreductase [Psychrobium sp. 1_MG-2023]PKF56326.1 oxidoreductase [Alteromonadales bacterium alter-6D02]